MRIEESSTYTHKIVLESGESLSIVANHNTHRLDLEYGDNYAPDAENKVQAEIVIVRSL